MDPVSAKMAGAEPSAAAAKKVAMLNCNGVACEISPVGEKKFAQVLAKAQATGAYEGKPLGPDGHNVNSYLDSLKVKGMSDTRAVELTNAKFGVNIQPNAPMATV